MGDRDPPDTRTYRPELADLERVGTYDMRDQIVGNDKRVFTTNRLLFRLLCTTIYKDTVCEGMRICSSAVSEFRFGRADIVFVLPV